MSFLHVQSNVMPLLKALIKCFNSLSYTDELWSIYEYIMTSKYEKKIKINCALNSLIHLICSKWLDYENQTNQQLLTFKVTMKVNLESFNSCLQLLPSCYLLGKGGYVFGSVGLSVCLWTTFLKKVMNGLGWNFMEESWVVQWRTD